jgi:hypothetical protein
MTMTDSSDEFITEMPDGKPNAKLASAHERVRAILDEAGLYYDCTFTDGKNGVVFTKLPVDTDTPTPEEALKRIAPDDLSKVASVMAFLIDADLTHAGRNLMLCSAIFDLIYAGKAPKLSAESFGQNIFMALGHFASSFDELLAMAKKAYENMESVHEELQAVMNEVVNAHKTPEEAVADVQKLMRKRGFKLGSARATPPSEEKEGAA